MKPTMTHEEIRDAVSEVYNSFYLHNRKKGQQKRSVEDWEKINKDAEEIKIKYNSMLVHKILQAFLEEFFNEDIGE